MHACTHVHTHTHAHAHTHTHTHAHTHTHTHVRTHTHTHARTHARTHTHTHTHAHTHTHTHTHARTHARTHTHAHTHTHTHWTLGTAVKKSLEMLNGCVFRTALKEEEESERWRSEVDCSKLMGHHKKTTFFPNVLVPQVEFMSLVFTHVTYLHVNTRIVLV